MIFEMEAPIAVPVKLYTFTRIVLLKTCVDKETQHWETEQTNQKLIECCQRIRTGDVSLNRVFMSVHLCRINLFSRHTASTSNRI